MRNGALILILSLLTAYPFSASAEGKRNVRAGAQADSTLVRTNAASGPVFKFSSGDKHINVERLGLSPHTTVFEALQLFPEALSHGYSDNLSTYSVSIDGFSLGVAKDEALYQMTIAELREIVISDDPTGSYDSDGVGGSINLVTKAVPDGLSGNGQLDVSTEKDVLVSTSINYKRPKLTIQGYLKAEYFNIGDAATIRNFTDGVLVGSVDSTYNTRGGGGQLKLALTYTPTDKDNFKVAFWQRYSNDVDNIVRGDTQKETLGTGTGTFARLNYSHKFNGDRKIGLSASYSYSPSSTSENNVQRTSLRWSRPHSASGGINYSGTSFNDGVNRVAVNAGVKLNYSNSRIMKPGTDPYRTEKLSLIPSAELEWSFKDFVSLCLGGSYNFDHWSNSSTGKHKDTQDYMIRMEALGSPAPGHTLRLVCMRNQLPESNWEKVGHVVSTTLGYVLDLQRGEHMVNMSAALKYDHTDLIRESSSFDVLSPQFSLFWQVNWFSLGVAANCYVNFFPEEDNEALFVKSVRPKRMYSIVRLTPSFRLPRDWFLNSTLMYNTGVFDPNHIGGGYFFTALRVGKKIGNWLLHAELSDPFHYRTKDIRYDGVNTVETFRYPEVRYLNMGVTCNF